MGHKSLLADLGGRIVLVPLSHRRPARSQSVDDGASYHALRQGWRKFRNYFSYTPEVRWCYDTEIVSHLIAVITPVVRHVLAEKGQHRGAELLEGAVAFVVGDMPVVSAQPA